MACNPHPDAPHGFLRNSSHDEDRYVCECEYWEKPKMDELIKELMGETLNSKFTHTWTKMNYEDLEKFSEKFAELIVAECLQYLKNEAERLYMLEDEDADMLAEKCYDNIQGLQDHFGIEE